MKWGMLIAVAMNACAPALRKSRFARPLRSRGNENDERQPADQQEVDDRD